MKRRDFAFHKLTNEESGKEPSLFSDHSLPRRSDLGGNIFIPEPIKEFTVIYSLRITDADFT